VCNVHLDQAGERERTLLRREKVSIIFQFYNLMPSLSAQDNVALPLLARGNSWGEARQSAVESLRSVGLDHRLKTGRINFQGVNSNVWQSPFRKDQAGKQRARGCPESSSSCSLTYKEQLSVNSISPFGWPERTKESDCSCFPFDFGESAYHMTQCKEPYHELGGDYFDKRRVEASVKHLVKQMEFLGFSVSLGQASSRRLIFYFQVGKEIY
jgi:hypothetical protein